MSFKIGDRLKLKDGVVPNYRYNGVLLAQDTFNVFNGKIMVVKTIANPWGDDTVAYVFEDGGNHRLTEDMLDYWQDENEVI